MPVPAVGAVPWVQPGGGRAGRSAVPRLGCMASSVVLGAVPDFPSPRPQTGSCSGPHLDPGAGSSHWLSCCSHLGLQWMWQSHAVTSPGDVAAGGRATPLVQVTLLPGRCRSPFGGPAGVMGPVSAPSPWMWPTDEWRRSRRPRVKVTLAAGTPRGPGEKAPHLCRITPGESRDSVRAAQAA